MALEGGRVACSIGKSIADYWLQAEMKWSSARDKI